MSDEPGQYELEELHDLLIRYLSQDMVSARRIRDVLLPACLERPVVQRETLKEDPDLEVQFITYYNRLFGLPEEFGVEDVWLTAPNDEIRHPAAGGRSGWYDTFLQERIPDEELYGQARDVRRMLGTEADVLLLTDSTVVLVECKYKGTPSAEQYERHQMMGKTLARRLEKAFHFGMVSIGPRDPRFARIESPYVLWEDVRAKLKEQP